MMRSLTSVSILFHNRQLIILFLKICELGHGHLNCRWLLSRRYHYSIKMSVLRAPSPLCQRGEYLSHFDFVLKLP